MYATALSPPGPSAALAPPLVIPAPPLPGLEPARGGFADDVAVATEIDASVVVPVLTEGAFTGPAADGP